jgi:glycosyltransferase involved in cell wall biosynthesis
MKVWLVTVGEPLPMVDTGNPRLMRTGVLARHLRARGHEVIWWTSTFDHYAKKHRANEDRDYSWEGGEVRMLHSSGYRRNVSFRRFIEHAGIARKFARMAAGMPQPDVILVSLPTIELSLAAVGHAQARGIPVLVDIRDLWPDLLIDVAPGLLRPLARLALFWLISATHRALAGCTGIVGISDGYLAWALKYAGRAARAADIVVPLGYLAPPPGDNHAADATFAALGVDARKTLCWYVGSFGRQYDLEPVIEAARRFQAEGRGDVQFVVSGDGEMGPRWRASASDIGSLVFTGWIDADQINWMRERAAIGLQPYVAGAPQGLANKLFEYLSAGIPVVSSLEGENAELIEKFDCGLSYRAGDAGSCHAQLRALLDDPARRRKMGVNGRDLFVQQFDGSKVFDRLARHLESVAAREV